MAEFPVARMRRLRRTAGLRRMVRETTLHPTDLIYPLFVVPGKGVSQEILSMPGQHRFSVDMLLAQVEEVLRLGIPAVLLFGIPEEKDEAGSEAYAQDGIVQQAVRAIRDSAPEVVVITDVCLCAYMSHGHCGLIREGYVDNDATLGLLARAAVSHAAAGADVVAPSDMMDGRVGAIRQALDENGFGLTPILSYAAKYASAFYGPFRDAAGSVPQSGDRRSHQMDPANVREALREIELDLQEGADAVMVKPALAYLDVIAQARRRFDAPIVAYNVSGEYAMVKAAAQRGWVDEPSLVLEILTAIKRAGADMIITYHAQEACRWLAGG